ncbi:TerB N-terminal domain-containing protein [Micromonospora sp. LOL_023]|uniref:TerB N-terminal domain-containing protein n=1 Tax=Micromonospora sp. LOL_023 TaxID=3345418 RepID=UPI003A86D2B9
MASRTELAAGRWSPPGEPVAVGGHVIPGGLIYVGRHLGSAAGVEPALINPDLPAAASARSAADPGSGPALAYHLLAPATRAEYLAWLAGGRHTDVAAALIQLFCFGLERRVLVDADEHPSAVRRELPAITAEVRRLRGRYGAGGPALRGTLDGLLQLLELLTTVPAAGELPPASRPAVAGRDPDGHGSTTMAVRVALARFAAEATPVPADWALAWVRHHPSLPKRSAQLTCSTEFDRLFALRYRDQHGPGIVAPNDLPGVRLRYQPANPGLATTLVCREDLPDVLAEPRTTRALGALVDSVAADLDPYRRWLARFPQGRGSLAAATLLPPALVDAGHGRLGALRVWGERQLDGGPRVIVDAAEFWTFWSTAAPDRMARDEAAALLAVLGLLGFGVEPDVRFGAPALRPGPAMLFRLGRPMSDRPSARFPAAAAVARCAAAVVSATGPIDPRSAPAAATLATVGDLAAVLRLDPGEDQRLAARLGWHLATGVDVDRLGRQTARLTMAEREIAGRYLVLVAVAADPVVGPGVVAALTRIYRILDLDPDLVFRRLHERSVGGAPGFVIAAQAATAQLTAAPVTAAAGSTPAGPSSPTGDAGPAAVRRCDEPDGPVVVQAAEAVPSGYALPWASSGPPPASPVTATAPGGRARPAGGVPLDRAAVQRKIAESSRVSTLLTAIFDAGPAAGQDSGPAAGQDAGPAPVDRGSAAPPEVEAVPIPGLDPAHSALMRALADRPHWTREEFTSLAVAHRVLPDGALDVLNEAAIDAVGAPIIDGDAPLLVDNDVLLDWLDDLPEHTGPDQPDQAA